MLGRSPTYSRDDFKLEKDLTFAGLYTSADRLMLMVKYYEGVEIDYEKGMIVIEEVYPILKSGIRLGLTDATARYISITKKARELYSNNKSMHLNNAHAVVVKDLHTRMLANFFSKFNNPVVPVKTFNSMDKAINWLYGFKD